MFSLSSLFGRRPASGMSRSQSSLWQELAKFQFDEPNAARTFALRLAEANGWTADFTRGAIEEYRKYLFLAVEAGHPVTPSKSVDEVWHMHMLYTVSYWHRLCRDTLRQELHHHPSLGGMAEDTKYAGQFQRTLRSYVRFFGRPPVEYWGPMTEEDYRASSTRNEERRRDSGSSHSSFVDSSGGCGSMSTSHTHSSLLDTISSSFFGGGESGGGGGGADFGDSGGSSCGGDSGGSSCGGDSGGSSCGGGGCGGGD